MSRIDVHGHQSQGGPLLPRFTRQMSGLLARVTDSVRNRLEVPAKHQLDSHVPTRHDRDDEALTVRPQKKKIPSLRRRPSIARGKRLSAALAARGGRVLSDSVDTSTETFHGSSSHRDVPMFVRVAIGDTSVITSYVTDELPPRSSGSEGINNPRSIIAASENPQRTNSPKTQSELVSQRAYMPEAFCDQVLMTDHTCGEPAQKFRRESRVPSSPDWSDSEHEAIKARAASKSHGCQLLGSPSRNPGILPISVHLSQKDEGAKQALLWESASASTAASEEELRLAGVLAPRQRVLSKSYSSDDEASDPLFDATRQHAKEAPFTVFQDAALTLADLVAEVSENPTAMWWT